MACLKSFGCSAMAIHAAEPSLNLANILDQTVRKSWVGTAVCSGSGFARPSACRKMHRTQRERDTLAL